MGDTVYNLDDLILAPDKIKEAKVYRRAKVRPDHEIELPTEEREILHREIVSISEFRRMARQIVDMYFTPDRDYLAQNFYLEEYRANRYLLPWLVPIVNDRKFVYKKKYVGPMTVLQDGADLLRNINGFVNYANFDQPQALLEALHNYVDVSDGKGVRIRNHLGSHVLRATTEIQDVSELEKKSNLQFRGSYGTIQGISLVERQKTANRNLIVGYDTYDQVVGEQLHVIGFAEFPLKFPSRKHEDWFKWAKISLTGGGSELDTILNNALPKVEQVLEKHSDILTGVTDFRIILELLEEYGHPVQSLTESNRKSITDLILANLELFEPDTYTRTTRLEYPMLEKELVGEKGSGILEKNVLEENAIQTYGIDFQKFPHLFSKYLKIVRQLDNGEIWITLINPESTDKEVESAIKDFKIFKEYREVTRSLKDSYFNLVKKTIPNQELFEGIEENPLNNIQEVRGEKRDQIAWTRYFKKAYLGKDGISYYWRGKRIGCQHEYDRLYKMFEDPDDSFPYGKKWTEITPFGGIMCGFCGDTVVEDDEIVSQGYDVRGQRINTYDNEGLVKQPSNIDLYFQEKTEIIKSGEKMVDIWIHLSQQQSNDRFVRSLKYKLLKPYEEIIQQGKFHSGLQQNPNKMMKTTNRALGEFLVKKYEITNPGNFPTGWFLREKIFPLFYSLSGVYELLIHRLSIFLMVLNWHLVHKDPMYLNFNVLLKMFTPEQVGKYFFIYQLNQRAAFQSLTTGKKDSIQDNFIESAQKIVPRKKLSTMEYRTKLEELYVENKKKYLWVPSHQGEIFNGDNPLEHEIVMIFSEYLKSIGKMSVMDKLEELFQTYWKKWTSKHKTEILKLEEHNQISVMGKEALLRRIDPGNRPLYDRFLAQHRVYKLQQLEQIYLDLVNDQIHNIQVSSVTRQGGRGSGGKQIGGHTFCPQAGARNIVYSETIMKKMLILNRMNCEDWNELDDLDLIGLETETQRINAILSLKADIAGLERQIAAGGILVRPYVNEDSGYLKGLPQRSRKFDIYQMLYEPVTEVGKNTPFVQMTRAKDYKVPEPPKVKNKSVAKLDFLVGKLKFLVGGSLVAGKTIKSMSMLTQMINTLGSISWYSEAEKWSKHHHAVVSDQMAGASQCNTSAELTPEQKNNFESNFEAWNQNMYVPSKARLLNLKKYILTYVRQRIYILETITDRETLVKYGLEKYLSLFDYDAFNDAFKEFNGGKGVDKSKIPADEYGHVYTNDEINSMVLQQLEEDASESDRMKVVDLLIRILLSDLVRQLDQVRTKAGRFRGSKSQRKVSSQINAGTIFEGFIRILFSELWETERVSDVDFHHRSINEQIRGKMIFDKFDKAEKKSPIDYTIARMKLQVEEEFDQIMDDTGGFMPGDEKKEDEWDDGVQITDNDEDDINEMEFSV